MRDAETLMGHSVVIGVAFGAVFTGAILGAGEALFSALGGRGEVLANALRYSSLVFGAAVPIWIVNLLAAALRGAGNVRIPAILTAVGAAMTLCLSPLLIFGWGPFPRFGVAGAGLAMIVYYVIATAALIAYLRSRHTPIRLVRTRIRWRLMKDSGVEHHGHEIVKPCCEHDRCHFILSPISAKNMAMTLLSAWNKRRAHELFGSHRARLTGRAVSALDAPYGQDIGPAPQSSYSLRCVMVIPEEPADCDLKVGRVSQLCARAGKVCAVFAREQGKSKRARARVRRCDLPSEIRTTGYLRVAQANVLAFSSHAEGITMRRTHCELSSRIDMTDACHSAEVGWRFAATSIARETSACGPGLASFQSIDQRVHAKSPPRSPNRAARHADSSTRTSTAFNADGPPHAAPLIL